MGTTLKDLVDDGLDELSDWAKENWPVRDSEVDDQAHEIADALVPVYHGDLIDLAAEDNWLATEEPDMMAFDGRSTAINAIASNVYQHIVDELMTAWQTYMEEDIEDQMDEDDLTEEEEEVFDDTAEDED